MIYVCSLTHCLWGKTSLLLYHTGGKSAKSVFQASRVLFWAQAYKVDLFIHDNLSFTDRLEPKPVDLDVYQL